MSDVFSSEENDKPLHDFFNEHNADIVSTADEYIFTDEW